MKLKNIFLTILFGAFALASCTKEYEITNLDELQLSETFVSIPTTGGEAKVEVTAKADWSFDKIFEVAKKDADGNDLKDDKGDKIYEYFETPDWLDVNPLSGKANEKVTITFKAGATDSGRETALVIAVAGKKQNITVRQGEVTASEATCADVIAGPDGKAFIVEGVCVSIENTTYGNWWLDDGTGKILIYGTLDSEGKTKNFSSLNIEVGDVVKVKGPKTTYGEKIELVDVKVLEHTKSLLKGLTPELTTKKDGGDVVAKFVVKGDGITFSVPDSVKTWARIVDFGTLKSNDIDDPDTTTVTINIDANIGAPRTGVITFRSEAYDEKKKEVIGTNAPVTFIQEGADVPISEFIKLDKDAVGSIVGIVTGVHQKGYIITDTEKNTLYCYENGDAAPAVKIGDEILVTGKKSDYNKIHQMYEPKYEIISSEKEVAYPLADKATDELWAEMSAEDAKSTSRFISVVGTPDMDNYGEIAFGDGCKVSLYYASKDFAYPTGFEGKTVVLKGYVLQVYTKDGAKTFRILPVSVAEATDADLAEPESTSVFDFTALVTGGATTYDVYLKDAVVTYVNGGNAFIEDATGGILLYKWEHGLVAGQKITGPVTGECKVFNGLPELTSMDYSGAKITSGAEILCTELSLADLLANYTRYMSCRVLLKGVTITDGVNLGDDRNGVVTQGENTINLYSSGKVAVIADGTSGDLICYPSIYNSNQLGIWETTDFTPAN